MRACPFPDPASADARGLLAYGGDLGPERLLSAYAHGVFPWYETDPILWFCPDPRMVLLPAELHVGRSLARALRGGAFEVRIDADFSAVIHHCARTPRPGQPGTWINDDMIDAYCALHRLGFAHSFEAWKDDVLVGGLYGVSLGAGFFGESMFAHRSDASKVVTVALARWLEERSFHFIDCQVHTEHLERFGAREWPRSEFLRALSEALVEPTLCGSWS